MDNKKFKVTIEERREDDKQGYKSYDTIYEQCFDQISMSDIVIFLNERKTKSNTHK